jgi:epoxyqueuosine reductase
MPTLAEDIRARAITLGFTDVGFTSALDDDRQARGLDAFLAAGWHGDMAWMQTTAERRRSARALWPQAQTAVMLAMAYPPPPDPFLRLGRGEEGVVAAYALGRDYHDVMKGRLKLLAQWFARRARADVKVFVDTAPLMEKPLAQRSGLGWQGKHTNLVSRTQGSWFFLGAMLTTASLGDDQPETDHCGSCRACLDVCPTNAFPAPYQLDATRCLSYLTIEHKGPIPVEFRRAMGNRIYGCDDCLAVCPWNKFASEAAEAKFAADPARMAPALAELAALGDQGFRAMFAGSAIKRTGWKRFLRNVLIAIGNSGATALAPEARRHLADDDPVVRGAAVWALRLLLSPQDLRDDAEAALARETEPAVIAEWVGVT